MCDNPWVIDGLFVGVDDLDAHYERARAAGATILREPEDPGVGFRIYTAEDPRATAGCSGNGSAREHAGRHRGARPRRRSRPREQGGWRRARRRPHGERWSSAGFILASRPARRRPRGPARRSTCPPTEAPRAARRRRLDANGMLDRCRVERWTILLRRRRGSEPVASDPCYFAATPRPRDSTAVDSLTPGRLESRPCRGHVLHLGETPYLEALAAPALARSRRSRRGRARTRSSSSSTRRSSRSAGEPARASSTSPPAPRSRWSRPTAAASPPSTGRASSSATRSST